MEDLIKGVDEVEISHLDRRNDDDDDSNNSESNVGHSRSTWAQVVSGEQDEVDQREELTIHDIDNHSYQTHSYNYGSDQDSQFPEILLPHQSYQLEEDEERPNYSQDEENEQDEDADGWQTTHKKRPHRVHMDHWGLYKRLTSEQQYSEDVNYAADIEPSEEELSDYTIACAKLWELDFNRLTPGEDYEVDVGEGKRVHDTEDMTEASLFTWVNEDVLRKPTYSRFCALLNNYNPYQGSKEDETDEDKQEQAAFIEEISRTAPIKYLYAYLSCSSIFTEDEEEFKRMLIELWFTLYDRGGTSESSSSFEHVFVGEIKQRGEEQVSGFHNWLQFYLEEAKGSADYRGYILPRRNEQSPDAETQLLTVQFEWNEVLKSLSSMFTGVSPEFEIALYTLCFFAGGQENHIEVGPYPVNIKCYRLGDRIGSVFPIAEA